MRSRRAPLALSLVLVAVAVGAATCGLLEGGEQSALETTAGSALGIEIFLGLLAIAGATLAPEGTWRRLGLRPGRLSPAQTLVLIAGTLGASAALDGMLDVTQLREQSALGEFEHLIAGARGRPLLLACLAFALAPGVAEELLCRGLVQRGLVRRLGAAPGILLASAVFGALHVDPIHALFAAMLGLYLGVASHLAAGIRTSMACHIVNNLVALGTGAFLPWLDAGGLPAVGAGGAVATGALWLVWRQVGLPPARAGEDPPDRWEAEPTGGDFSPERGEKHPL